MSDPCPDCIAIVDALNKATGKRYEVTSIVVGRLVHQRHKESGVEACMKVIADRVRAWGRDAKMAFYLRPATLFAKLNFAKYLDDIKAGNGRLVVEAGAVRTPYVPPATAPARVERPLRGFLTLQEAISYVAQAESWPEPVRQRNVAMLRGFAPGEADRWLAAHGARLEPEIPPI